MCELLYVHSERMFPIKKIFDYAELLDHFGVAGFGWGIVWKNEAGELQEYKSVDGICNDTMKRIVLSEVMATDYLVHLRRPSLMSTIGQYNVQPYLNERKELAFAHNGYFAHHAKYRDEFMTDLKGNSDSEVGFCYIESELMRGSTVQEAMVATHTALKGRANMLLFSAAEGIFAYNGSCENLMYRYSMDGAECISTSLHSLDNYLFESVFPKATHIERLPLDTVVNDRVKFV
ncbi:MAG: class II glutamine amidotransferase [Sporolactobacillus sp.]